MKTTTTRVERNVKENTIQIWKYVFEGENIVSSKCVAYMALPEGWSLQAAFEFMRHFGIQQNLY